MKILGVAHTAILLLLSTASIAASLPVVLKVALNSNISATHALRNDQSLSNIKSRAIWVDDSIQGGTTDWPLEQDPMYGPDGHRVHMIPYCFANQHAADLLQGNFMLAVQKWYDALGGDPMVFTNAAGHSLRIARYSNRFCFKDDYKDFKTWLRSGMGTWNLPGWEHALAIHVSEDQSASHAGFVPKEQNATPGRHWITLEATGVPPSPGMLRVYMHELGHVIGLGHEHQHPNANTKIRSNNVVYIDRDVQRGFSTIRKDNIQQWKNDHILGEAKMRDYLCSREGFYDALELGSYCTEMMKNRPGFKVVAPYDEDSIMNYGTVLQTAPGIYVVWDGSQDPSSFDPDKADMTLLHEDGTEHPIVAPLTISRGDAAAVKARYPW